MDKYFWFLKKSIALLLILYFGHEKLLKGKKMLQILHFRQLAFSR